MPLSWTRQTWDSSGILAGWGLRCVITSMLHTGSVTSTHKMQNYAQVKHLCLVIYLNYVCLGFFSTITFVSSPFLSLDYRLMSLQDSQTHVKITDDSLTPPQYLHLQLQPVTQKKGQPITLGRHCLQIAFTITERFSQISSAVLCMNVSSFALSHPIDVEKWHNSYKVPTSLSCFSFIHLTHERIKSR